MTERLDTPDDLFPFAEALVRRIVRRYQLEWDAHCTADAIQKEYSTRVCVGERRIMM